MKDGKTMNKIKCSKCGKFWFEDLDAQEEYIEIIHYNVPFLEDKMIVIKTVREILCLDCFHTKINVWDY